jgi:murein DD-endopeptidase MepM/ murein hydrolase activator NlpD
MRSPSTLRFYQQAEAMMRHFALVIITIAAGAIAPASSALACGPQPLPVGPEASIDGAPHFIWPLRGTLVSDICSNGSERRFKGIDIAAPEGTSVEAAADGVVLYAGNELKDYGNVILVRHNGDWVTAYAYVENPQVKRGDAVRQGDVIAVSGHSITMNTPLLHFEIRKQSSAVDPLRLLPERHDG